MDSHNNQEEELALDEWQLKLEEKLKELIVCQKQQGLDSCLNCSELFECKLRDSYVHAVYSSMNKGSGGGFEF